MERHSRSPSLSSGLESAYSPRRSSGASSHYSVSRTPSPAPSADNDDGDDDTPAQKLTRAEIGGYAALLSGLRARDGSGLAARLLSGVPRWALRSPTPEEEDELASSSAPGSPATPTTARTRRGSAAPSLVFSEPPVPEEQADAATRWPLHPAELEPGPPLAAALADAAARVVHRDALALPRPALGAINLRRKRRREEEEGSEEEEALAPEVADVVAARVSMVLDRTLASLAAMQGVSLARDRKVMAWPAVLAAAGMVADQRVVESAAARLDGIFRGERADAERLRLRLDRAQDVRAAHRADAHEMFDALYALPPLVVRRAGGRRHRKAEDVASMAAKQEAREAKHQKKRDLKDERRAAREARREAKRLKEKERLQKYHAK